MRVTSECPDLSATAVRAALRGLPGPAGYSVHVKPLRYRDRPHLSAWTDLDDHAITLQVPEPFLPFGEVIPYGAKRRPGKGMRFIWLTEGITLHTPREVLRYLYLHEWMHAWSHTEGHRAGETACDRFALRNYQRDTVTVDDAVAALRRRSD